MVWSKSELENLTIHFEGKLYLDQTQDSEIARKIYSTDASVYQVKPIAVAIPANYKDIKRLIHFAKKHKTSIIPRGAGTSLAGQVVGNGIVMELASNLSKILLLNKKEKSVWVEPGIIRDDLNKQIETSGLFFGPETSTANRALMGGMLGNNSCGLHSIVWGNVRDHLLETRAILSDGTEIHTHPLSNEEFYKKTSLNNLEGYIYKEIHRILNNPELQNQIKSRFPKAEIKRRNSGYALDALIDMQPFNPMGQPFNLSALLAGSEGTLAIVHSMKLNLLDLPANEVALICIHCQSIQESLEANIVVLTHQPTASELVDDYILSFTENHPNFQYDRDFIEGKPAAILMVEFRSNTTEDLNRQVEACIKSLQDSQLGYAYPVLDKNNIDKGWGIRKAGLGLIRNAISKKQPVNLIEDCAVSPLDLPNYIAEIQALLAKYKVEAAYYAHAGAGELHIEPFLDINSAEGKILFRTILSETVDILKKYQGSLSGEHGDGRLRGEFIEKMMGKELLELFKEIKDIFDPSQILNPGKIVNSPPMDEEFRISNSKEYKITNFFNYGDFENPLRLAEKCSGSGDCKKTSLTGGTMCPSFMATLDEKDSTRARANMLRQILSEPSENPFTNPELNEILDLCLSCKGCQTECPSGVDITKLKAETLQQKYLTDGIPWRTQMVGHFPLLQNLARKFAPIYNFFIDFPVSSIIIKTLLGFSWERSLPKVHFYSLEDWFKKYAKKYPQNQFKHGFIYLFADEFTNYNEVDLGKKTVLLLNELGFGVKIPFGVISGRSYLSKGMLIEARKIAEKNIAILSPIINAEEPFIGIEPSAILTFRDEIPDLVRPELRELALQIGKNCLLVDEFLSQQIKNKKILKSDFKQENKKIILHGHCHQKSIAGLVPTRHVLSFPENQEVELLPTGCCGMAGSFGYERKHYKISQQIANLVLFPRVLAAKDSVIIASNGTSCRHQLKDGIQKTGQHTVEIMYDSLAQKTFKS